MHYLEPRERGFHFPQLSLRDLLLLVFAIALALAVAKWLSGQMGDAGPVTERIACRNNLMEIWHAILDHVNQHGDIPRGSDGEFSLTALASSMQRETICPAAKDLRSDESMGGYRVAKKVSLTTFQPDADPVPIVFDASPVHGGDRSIANVLYSDGHVGVWSGTNAEYEEWIAESTK